MDFTALFTGIDFSNPTWDLFILIFFVVAAVFYGISLGRDRIIGILVSIYMALAVVAYAPFLPNFTASITINEAFAFRVSMFVGLFVLVFFLLSRSGLAKTMGDGERLGSWWQIILFSFFHVGLLISVTLSFLPIEVSQGLAPITRALFVDETARFVWLVAPILAMALIPKD